MHFHLVIKLWIAIFILTLSGLFITAHAATILIDGDTENTNLAPHYQLYVDTTHNVTIDQILSLNGTINFLPIPEKRDNLGFRKETHWFKVNTVNPSDQELQRLLEFDFPLLDDLSVYLVDKASKKILANYDAGDRQPFNQRQYLHPHFVFPITLPAQSNTSLYVRIHTEGSMTAGASLWQPEAYVKHSRIEYFYINLYIGLLIAMIGYNLLLFISIREISYLFYVCFASSMLLAIGSFNGLWFELFWPNSPWWHNISIPLGFSLAGLFACLFSKHFLQSTANIPLIEKPFNFLAYIYATIAFLSTFISVSYSSQALSVVAFMLVLLAITAGTLLTVQGHRHARIYLLAWISVLLGTALLSARNFGLLPNNILTLHSLMFGSALEMILLSFALAERINFFRTANDLSRQEAFQTHSKLIDVLRNSERELIHRVKKRTESLALANEKLTQQEQELKKLAHYDTLTGLANRALITEQLDLLLTHCKREKIKLAVLFLDLDGFKAINDKFGHKVGDELLIVIADKLRFLLRDSDVVGRLGGDEFIVLIESSDGALDPQQVAQKIKDTISQPVTIDGLTIECGISIGIAIYPDDGDNVDSLMSISDTAMYIDKGYREKTVSTTSP